MPLAIGPVLDSDIEAVNILDFTAFLDDLIHHTIFPNGASDITIAHHAAQDRKDLHEDPTFKPMKVYNSETGEIAAYGRWVFFSQREQKDLDVPEDLKLPSDTNIELGNKVIREGLKKRHEIMGTVPYAYLAILVTAVPYRKQGAGSMLLEWGLKIADEQHLPAYLEATPAGAPLYKKFGFVESEKLRIDLRPWKDYDRVHLCMVRPAR